MHVRLWRLFDHGSGHGLYGSTPSCNNNADGRGIYDRRLECRFEQRGRYRR